MKLAGSRAQPQSGPYELVPDGQKFGIAFRGEIIIRGLDSADLERAQRVIAILNSFIEDEMAG